MRVIKSPVPFSEMFLAVEKSRGRTEEQCWASWEKYLANNPMLKRQWETKLERQRKYDERRRS